MSARGFHTRCPGGVLPNRMTSERGSGRGALGRVVLGVALGAVAWSQLLAQEAPRGPGPGFLVARYATRSALAFYGGYALGPGFAVVGLAQNPRTGYREADLGVGTPVLRGLTLVLTVANTSDGWFAKGYLLPSYRVGPLAMDGSLEWYQPLGPGGTRELDLSPLTAIVAVSRSVGVGAAYHLSAAAGAPPSQTTGPALRVEIPRGSVTLELQRGLTHASSELRLTVKTSR